MQILTDLLSAMRAAAAHPLSGKSPWHANVAFLRAQFAARLAHEEVCVPLPDGRKLLVPPRMKGAHHFIYPTLFDFPEMSFVMHYLRPSDFFVDVGANIGIYTVLASAVAGARTAAFEPSIANFAVLRKNVEINALDNLVTLYSAAVGRNSGTVQVSGELGTETHVVSPTESGGMEMPMLSLDTTLVNEAATFLKVDVEGYEPEVLLGAARVVTNPMLKVILIEAVGNERRYGYAGEPLDKQIEGWGFRPFIYTPEERRLRPVTTETPGNLIYLRDPAEAQLRVQQAKPYSFNGFSV